jgi:hypothetical protein
MIKNTGADILATWKTSRFIVADPDLVDHYGSYLIVLTDYQFWSDQHQNLAEWCASHNSKLSGMTVEIAETNDLTLFLLRWS